MNRNGAQHTPRQNTVANGLEDRQCVRGVLQGRQCSRHVYSPDPRTQGESVDVAAKPARLQDLAANIERMNQELGYTFFVIEHDMDLIGRLCDPVIVMAQGKVIAQGPMAEIRANPAIVEAYFGTPVEADT